MITVKTRKWGNSIGVRIPKKTAKELGITADQEVAIEIVPKNPLRELFGIGKFDEPTEKILRDIRKGVESKYI